MECSNEAVPALVAKALEALPAYQGGGELAPSVFPCGPMMRDLNSEKSLSAVMRYVAGASEVDYVTYLAALADAGWREEWQRELGGNRYACCYQDGMRVFLSYTRGRERLTVILDDGSMSEEAFNDAANAPDTCRAEFFLYGLNMDPGGYNPNGKPDSHLNTTGLANCGMLLAMKGCDGKLIIVDGGLSSQWKYQDSMKELDAFLHQVAGKEQGEPVDIACWYLTHFHSDHVNGFYDLLNEHPGSYQLERVLCNLPVLADYKGNNEAMMKKLSALIAEKYPNCREIKAHTGNVFRFSGITWEVLYTHEDGVLEDRRIMKDSNDTSTVIRATAGGMSLMILGDLNKVGEEVMVQSFGDALKCEMVQAAHHNFNCLTEIYRFIHAPIAWFTQTEKGIVKNEMTTRNSDAVKAYSQIFYFAGDATRTVGFAEEGGEIREVYRHNAYLN